MRKNRIVIVGAFLVLMLMTSIFLLRQPSETARSRIPRSHSLSSSRTHLSPARGILYRVARVIDGDTIDVFLDGDQIERVRFIGIDTPETVDQRKLVQCYGPEASAKMKELLTGKSVVLEAKPDENKDDYGRFLRYVTLDGTDIGGLMLEEGYAKSLCAAFPHPRCSAYDAFEEMARSEKRGRWGACR